MSLSSDGQAKVPLVGQVVNVALSLVATTALSHFLSTHSSTPRSDSLRAVFVDRASFNGQPTND